MNPLNLLIPILLFLPSSILSQTTTTTSSSTTCPLDFSIAKPYISAAAASSSPPSDLCAFSLQILHLVESHYLLASNLFVPPSSSSSSCWSALSTAISPLSISLPSSCNFSALSISLPCMNISSRAAFSAALPSQALADLNSSCSRQLTSSLCTACTTTINRVKTSYLPGPDISNVTDCADYPFIYAAATNRFGPGDSPTAFLFLLQPPSSSSANGGGAALPPESLEARQP
ncbi:putative LRR receptor-like serine/threonine-protein kinase RKF3 [Platanthera guangdongensis]|uniref:LRR receptor-like serine/threonine-protein kinase RKF3 n=1 Tax=Platanthera guangdongensis TaxID=2320717 RepID=A0ABR2LUM6_9ASPA